MKYFTYELLGQFNDGDDAIARKASKQWDQNRKAYWRYIKRILPKLPRKAQHFLQRVELHDGTLLSFSTGDTLKRVNDAILTTKNYAAIDVLHPCLDFVYSLCYSKIRKCIIDYASNDADCLNEWIWDDWGYDEFGLTKDKWMQHEILFKSGATILLEFKSFLYRRKKYELSSGNHTASREK